MRDPECFYRLESSKSSVKVEPVDIRDTQFTDTRFISWHILYRKKV